MTNRQVIFVTGTDTDVGKTVVAGALVKGLRAAHTGCHYWKPIQAGLVQTDEGIVEAIVPGSSKPSALKIALAASPDQGLAQENQIGMTASQLAAALPEFTGNLIVEGAGGVLVPINSSAETWLDVLRHWRCPIIIVARTGLGTLNHTTLTVRHLLDTGNEVAGVVLNGERHLENEASLSKLLKNTPLHHFPKQLDVADPNLDDCLSLATFVQACTKSCATPTQEWDRKFVWHPYTQHSDTAEPVEFVGAQGPWLFTKSGRRLIDGSSSWWVNTIGHSREEIRTAISRQQAKMDHVIFANATHQPGAELASRLANLSNHLLTRVFYSDNGSTAVEIAIKMAFQVCQRRGEHQRTKFLTLEAGYHGDTIGTMAIGGCSGFHADFAPLMFECHRIKAVTSHPSLVSPSGPEVRELRLNELKTHLEKHHHEYAAFVLEPLVQGAGGMLVHDIEWLQQAVRMAKSFGLYIILDEVFTGMGRIGEPFAFQRASLNPDIVCLAKGLTGGTLPLAVTLTTEAIFEEFLSSKREHAFLHGHSYTGNPIACSAALATIDLFYQEQLCARARYLEMQFLAWIKEHQHSFPIEHARAIGGIMAMELRGEQSFNAYFDSRVQSIAKISVQNGLFLRTLGNTVYLVLPLTISDDDLAFTLSALSSTLSVF